MKLGSGPLEA